MSNGCQVVDTGANGKENVEELLGLGPVLWAHAEVQGICYCYIYEVD